jgi:hypothetical protein
MVDPIPTPARPTSDPADPARVAELHRGSCHPPPDQEAATRERVVRSLLLRPDVDASARR